MIFSRDAATHRLSVAPRTPMTFAREHADRCPGILRPWIAADGALIRLRLIGGAVSVDSLRALAAISAEWGDGNIHLTQRANVQLRTLPHHDGQVPAEIVAAITAAGLLPVPSHELVRNIMISPLTGRTGGYVDVRPIAGELDALLCADPLFASLAGRFLFVLDDGRGDLVNRRLDLGLMAVDPEAVQLRIGTQHWGPIVPVSDAAALLLAIARQFLLLRGTGPSALWHVDELPDGGAGLRTLRHPRDPRTHVLSAPLSYGIIGQDDGRTAHHLDEPDGIMTPDRTATALDLASTEIIVTPWRSALIPDLESR